MRTNKSHLEHLIRQVDNLIAEALKLENDSAADVKKVHPAFQKSARNLLHYLALRRHDIRDLQEQLAALGLSSLGRAEGHVLATLQAVRHQLSLLCKCPEKPTLPAVTLSESSGLLQVNNEQLLGPLPEKRVTRIMVTCSTELAEDYELLCRMLKAGMNCARINCAHDDEEVWLKMIRNVRRAEAELGISCKILMDLMGPKLRTGPLRTGPKMISIHPLRDELGIVSAPSRVWLAAAGENAPMRVDASLPVDADWVAQLQEGDELYFHDTRHRKRTLSVVCKEKNGVMAHLFKTSYIQTGTKLIVKNNSVTKRASLVGELKAIVPPIVLKKDHFLQLHPEPTPGEPEYYDVKGHIVKPAHISCTLPEVFKCVKAGEPILFDDGEIEGIIREANEHSILVQITGASVKGSKLRADKGINLPESKLNLNELTEKDKQDLKFIAKHADIVNLSFVNQPKMVEALLEEIKALGAKHLAVMLKIETKEAFRNLPRLLLAGMQHYPAGIMIARGDLAVECGWQRLAEVQEEILWLCEAAHMPVVWATQVLESLAKKGRPSRAEITDAAMSQRADCVMLNKGPHVVQAIQLLDDIMVRMQEHQHKKTSMLRSLRISELEKEA